MKQKAFLIVPDCANSEEGVAEVFGLGEGAALWSRVGIFLVKIYVLEIPQEHLQPSDSNGLFFLEEFSLNPTAIKGSVLNKDWRLRLCY